MGCFGGFFGFISVHRNSVSAQLPKHTETPFRLNYRTEPKFRSNTNSVCMYLDQKCHCPNPSGYKYQAGPQIRL